MPLEYLFAKLDYVKDETNKDNSIMIYPIKLKDYERFRRISNFLYISKNNFNEQFREYFLLDLLFLSYQNLGFDSLEEFIDNLCELFSMVTLCDVNFPENESRFVFYCDEVKKTIKPSNYEQIRNIIMSQNIMHEQKIYKTEIMNKWAQKALLAKQKNAPNITMEDMVSTISVKCGKHYWDLENYTIYQIYSDFYRIRKDTNYETSIQFKCSQNFDPKGMVIEDYAESLDLYHNPYDDLFVNADKLSGLNKAMGLS